LALTVSILRSFGIKRRTYRFNISLLPRSALMSRLWTGFFGTESCRTPKIFQNPDFSLKRRDFWVFL
jgi:hypothetical protein